MKKDEGTTVLTLVKSLNDIKQNITRFQDVVKPINQNSLTYQRFSSFKGWYFVEECGFGPGKFIGYANTSIRSYRGDGSGSHTKKRLEQFFVKLDTNSIQYHRLHRLLAAFAMNVGKTLSQKLYTSGGIYVLRECQTALAEGSGYDEIGASSCITGEGEALAKIRRGQEDFRNCLLQQAPMCWMSGITDFTLLVASHIKPWSHCESSSSERGDVNNGLLLSALWDAAFDSGLITFNENWQVVPSSKLSDEAKHALDLKNHVELPEEFRNEKRVDYMQYHRKKCFKR